MSIPDRVSALVNKVGRPITYRHLTGESFNVTTGVNTPTYSEIQVAASIREFAAREIMGNIRQGDRRATVAGKDFAFTPAKDDIVVIDGRSFSVISVESRDVLNESGVHVLQIRGLA